MQADVLPILLPILLFVVCVIGLAAVLLVLGNLFSPGRKSRVKRMPYESGMDPIHDTRRRFDVRFHLLAIAFLVFDVELLFLYPWAVTAQPAKLAAADAVASASIETSDPDDREASQGSSRTPTMQATVAALKGTELVEHRDLVFPGVMVFIALLTLGFIYDWRERGLSVAMSEPIIELPDNVRITVLDKLVSWCRSYSLWPMPYATACCGIELMATGASRTDISRFGAEVFRFSPRQCDLMIVAGRVVMKMMPVLQRIWQQMYEPKWCISMGACASTGGVFDTYSVVQGIDRFIPVNVYVPGCPPRPEQLIQSIIDLQTKIRAEDTMFCREFDAPSRQQPKRSLQK